MSLNIILNISIKLPLYSTLWLAHTFNAKRKDKYGTDLMQRRTRE